MTETSPSTPRPRAGASLIRRWLRPLAAGALGALLAGSALALAGCGEDDQHVAESYPSGARPAPVPAVEPQAAQQVELPPLPPAEPKVALPATAIAAADAQTATPAPAAAEPAGATTPGGAPPPNAATRSATPPPAH
jgi:hypothetical protein